MVKRIKFRKFIVSLLAATLISTSLGGTFTASALAAEASQGAIDSKAAVGGLLLLGLVSMLSHGHSDSSAAQPAKATTSNGTSTAANSSTGTTSTSSQPSTTTSSGSSLQAQEQQAFTLLNQDRTANGLKPLKLNSSLLKLAENYAQDMINRNYFAHTNPEGQTPFDRMNQAGISYGYAGENIAINNSASGAETAFMNSSGHRANILNANYTEVGVGIRKASNGSLYVVQEFIGK